MAKKKLTETVVKNLKDDELWDTDVRGFHVRLRASGKFFYYSYRVKSTGQKRKASIGRYGDLTVVQAREVAQSMAGEVALGKDPIAEKEAARIEVARSKNATLEIFLDGEYKEVTSKKTANDVIPTVKNHFSEYLEKDMSEITAWKIEKWKKAYKGEAAGCNRILESLRGVLTKAVKAGLLTKHPLEGVKGNKVDKKKKVRYLSAEEEIRLRKALGDREQELRAKRTRYNKWLLQRRKPLKPDLTKLKFADYLKPMTLVTLHTGIRRGEVFNLKVRDVDFSARVLTVAGGGAKSGESRHIPLNKEAYSVLKQWVEQNKLERGDLVFANPNTGKRFDNIKNAWKSLMESADLENFRFHDLRHTFGTRLAQRGVDLETLRDLMGHSDIKTTQIYLHTSNQLKVDAVAKLEQMAFQDEDSSAKVVKLS
ncbi:site-specific integrase [Endozoicomonas montiporae]|uniref:Integrase family protein n=1 Tax=Endozoicomonas montiporae CL-33 TaxID=570277 RepID=A0A142BHD0_9GAMM|nr:site-specific integrase [Endozoicomonas montiporae]AMO58156.1 integrase family protein [Endozoicomonas montiporae CL-33]